MREWAQEDRMLVPKAAIRECRYGGYASGRRKATGFFRVEKISDRWWFIDPEGCRFYSTGVNGAGAEPPRTQIVGRSKLFASIPTFAQFPAPGADAGSAARSRCRSTWPTCCKRFGRDWRTPERAAHVAPHARVGPEHRLWHGAQRCAARRVRRSASPTSIRFAAGSRAKAPSWACPMCIPKRSRGASMRRPRSSSRTRKTDPWMIGYFIGNEPPWPARESQLVDLRAGRPEERDPGSLQERARQGRHAGDPQGARARRVHAISRDRECRRQARTTLTT